jgi:beta-glucosidase
VARVSAGTPPAEEIDRLLGKLTLDQKIRLLSGAGTFRTAAEEAVGLRAISFSDGPVGVRGERWDERDTSLALPSPTALAASWDPGLVRRLGVLLAAEARRKGVDVLLAPNLNLHRSPFGGRHFECFSEDPLLTARIGAAYVAGVQDGGVAATPKHYVGNESETDRLTMDSRIPEATLREVYLAPFEAAVRAGAWLVMSAYNRVNGASMSESPLLADPLKEEWGFDGVVVSDWGAVRSTEAAARAAQDLAMPGPHPAWGEPLAEAVRDGRVPAATVDDKVRRLLLLAARVGALAGFPPPEPPPAPDAAGARVLLRTAAAAGTVLLRNRGGLLPLSRTGLRRVAVLGCHAAEPRLQGGGSAEVFPARWSTPLDAIRAALRGTGAEVAYEPGPRPPGRPTPLTERLCRDPRTGRPGVRVRYLDVAGAELHSELRLSGRVLEPADAPDPADPGALDRAALIEVTATLTPDEDGRWLVGVAGLGPLTLEADGRTLIAEDVRPLSGDPTHLHVTPPHRSAGLAVRAGRPVALRATRRMEPELGRVLTVTADRPVTDPGIALSRAVETAREADVVLVFTGTTDSTEVEGQDRDTLALPGRQDDLVAAVAAANPRTAVVVNSGGPVELPWHEAVDAVLLGWFPGQEAGGALADVLFGVTEPGGRLPTTWPVRTGDAPVLTTTPVDGMLGYVEGPHIGYRAWLRSGRRPAYWFGHGLGYTTWEYERLEAPARIDPHGGAEVRVRVRNTGSRTGREVVQVYLADPAGGPGAAGSLRLAGFTAVRAEPGESVTALVRIEPRAFQQWSTGHGGWRPRPGASLLLAGPSAAVLPLSARLDPAG